MLNTVDKILLICSIMSLVTWVSALAAKLMSSCPLSSERATFLRPLASLWVAAWEALPSLAVASSFLTSFHLSYCFAALLYSCSAGENWFLYVLFLYVSLAFLLLFLCFPYAFQMFFHCFLTCFPLLFLCFSPHLYMDFCGQLFSWLCSCPYRGNPFLEIWDFEKLFS